MKYFSRKSVLPWFCASLLRSFSDSCFLSSPLCSEVADVQWYGHDKAKPGTLVWDLPLGPRKVPLTSPTASPSSHYFPLTTNNLILKALQKPCPDRTGRLDMSLPLSLNLPLHISHHPFIIPLCHSSAGQGHTCWAAKRANLTGQTEKCHLSCCTLALQHHKARFFTHLHNTSNGATG